jgi:peroxiredoxin
MSVSVGELAPAFSLPDEDGREVRLPGKPPTLLVFYRGDW